MSQSRAAARHGGPMLLARVAQPELERTPPEREVGGSSPPAGIEVLPFKCR